MKSRFPGTEYVAECFYDETSGIYRAVVKSGTYMAAGQWMVKQIIIEDNYNNVLNLYNSQLAAGSENVLDLSAGNFIVNGTEADFDAPKIDEASISAEGLVLTTGNSFHAAMKVTDDLSGVENGCH